MITFACYHDCAIETSNYLWVFDDDKKAEAWKMISECRQQGCSLSFSLFLAYSELYREPIYMEEDYTEDEDE